MSAEANGDTPPADGLRGRFRLVPPEQGSGAILAWATDLCDRCLECGCGTQREPLDLTPQGAMKTFQRLREFQKNGLPG